MPFLLLSVALLAALVLLLTSAQALVSQGAFRVRALSRRVERLALENDLLRLRAARLGAPERVARAGHRAGLVVPVRVEVLEGRR